MGPAERPAPHLEFKHATRAQDGAIVLGNVLYLLETDVIFLQTEEEVLEGPQALYQMKARSCRLIRFLTAQRLRFNMIHGLKHTGEVVRPIAAFWQLPSCFRVFAVMSRVVHRTRHGSRNWGRILCGESSPRSLAEMTEIPRH